MPFFISMLSGVWPSVFMPKVVGSDDDDGKTEKDEDSHDENGRNILAGDMTLIITALRIMALRILKLRMTKLRIRKLRITIH